MATLESSGTQTTVAATDHTLAAPTSAKTRVLTLDLNALTGINTLEITISMPVLSGGTSRVCQKVSFMGHSISGDPIVQSFPVEMMYGGSFVIRCSAAISIPWRIVTLD